MTTATPARVLTGDRPTGPLHLGHYFGSLRNRVRLQQAGHELFVVIADYQVITDRDRPDDLRRTVDELVLDYLSCGLDPERTTIFPHSQLPALNQLMLPFLSLVGMGELSRNPTVKDEIAVAGRPSVSGLMMTYPVHQAADVLFCKAALVPVGRDQLPHLELTRSIARRFNDRYGPVFPLPEGLLGEAPRLAGFDGRKMSKSLRNGIDLTDGDDVIAAKIRAARTDSDPRITFDPQGRPEVATLLQLGALCTDRTPEQLAGEVRGGASALKALVIESVVQFLQPVRRRRAEFSTADARQILGLGVDRAADIAEATLAEVRDAMQMTYGPRVSLPTAAGG